MTSPPNLSIVIVNWNTCDLLVDALASIYATESAISVETIVVDNASADGSAEAVRSRFPYVKLMALDHNTGYARGNNLGIEASSGDFVLLLNPDVVLPPGGLDRAVNICRTREKIGALGCRLVNPDGSVQRSVRGFPTPLAVLFEALALSRLFPGSKLFGAYRMTYFTYDVECDVDQPMGTFLLIPRGVLDDVGVIDEQFPIFFNEVDWCYRAKEKGWRILFTPEVEVVHYGGASTKQVRARMIWESRRSLLNFYRKHYTSPLFAPVYWLTVIASWIHARIASAGKSVD